MTIQVALHHKSHYVFDRQVVISPHEIRLRPAAHSRTPISSYSLNIKPANHFVHWQQDAYGNFVARITFPKPTQEIEINVDLIADMTIINPFDFFVEDWAEHFPFTYPANLKTELAPFLEIVNDSPRLDAWLKHFSMHIPEDITTTNFLVYVNQQLHNEINYLIRMEAGVQSCEETLENKSGSCRDSAWLLVQILRHLGIAARFVSGYLIQLVADEKSLDGPSGTDIDFTDLHAWCEAYIPGAGWVGLDATSGLLAGEGHIPLAATAIPSSAAPVSGMTSVCESTLDVEMIVTRIHEDPRVTKPFNEKQWQTIQDLGEIVDLQLKDLDVRLTQGGEPTFVSVDNMEGAEWNIAALGEEKWTLANTLLTRLQQRFAPHSALHFGQGKWYPGEPLPRWALSMYWRSDNVPVWHNESLIAMQSQLIETTTLRTFAEKLTARLALNSGYLIPAYEDPWIALDKESRQPINIDTHKIDLQGNLGEIIGYVLPLKALNKTHKWKSSLWPLRHDRLYLVPGDSPMGLRLPLNSLPWVAPEDFDIELPCDPFAEQSPLADYPCDKEIEKPDEIHTAPTPKEVIHTALVFEVREGFLYVFMPPLTLLETWLELVAAIEDTAKKCALPIRLEGYAPPRDSRLLSLSITPDPGVIEVNIHPVATWQELVKNTKILYEEARLTRLCAEKFMLDGRHTGTGGGNHITLGGITASDSPFLRRPDLLTNLVLATEAPLLIVPAMHPAMWLDPATVENVRTLRSRGYVVMEPEVGRLTGTDSGQGRFPETSAIIEKFDSITGNIRDLVGKRILISGGGTREAIDPVRFIGNRSSGKQACALATAALLRGADVHLVAANMSTQALAGATITEVESALDMQRVLTQEFPQCDVLVMCAAVADAKPVMKFTEKIKKTFLTSIELEPNPDIVAELAQIKKGQLMIGFAAETSDHLESARAKLVAKGLDAIYVNDVSNGAIFGKETTQGMILSRTGADIALKEVSKDALAHLLLDYAAGQLG